MKVRPLYKLAVVILTGIAISSCKDKPVYPSEPVIAYKDFIRYGNPSSPDSVELVVSFTDNEGDIGLDQADTLGDFKKGNFCMIPFFPDTVTAGLWIPFDDLATAALDTFKVFYRVPPVLPDGDPSEPMKGLIYVKQSDFEVIVPKIMYKAYMYDKAKHKSNTIETPPIVF
ncbi:MAG: hypothetical protein HY841_02470 [Bacteroidetes bacterium]|nr:hypothetical protein [Bacteroidota bacterium]